MNKKDQQNEAELFTLIKKWKKEGVEPLRIITYLINAKGFAIASVHSLDEAFEETLEHYSNENYKKIMGEIARKYRKLFKDGIKIDS